MNKLRGFTLIEILVAVAIVGILGAIAYPNYVDYVRKAKRVDAKEALARGAALQERWYLQNNSYSADAADIGTGLSEEGHYEISITGTDCSGDEGAQRCYGYLMTATALASSSQIGDEDCRSFTIDNLGRKAATDIDGAANEDCW